MTDFGDAISKLFLGLYRPTNCKIGLTMKFIRYLESLVLKKTHYMIPAR